MGSPNKCFWIRGCKVSQDRIRGHEQVSPDKGLFSAEENSCIDARHTLFKAKHCPKYLSDAYNLILVYLPPLPTLFSNEY